MRRLVKYYRTVTIVLGLFILACALAVLSDDSFKNVFSVLALAAGSFMNLVLAHRARYEDKGLYMAVMLLLSFGCAVAAVYLILLGIYG